jgi:hypothetical protein
MKELEVQGFLIHVYEDVSAEDEEELGEDFQCVDGKVVIYDPLQELTDEGALILVKYLKDEGLIESLSVWCEIII